MWPENLEAWNHWAQVQSQWRVGMSGRTGLCYAGVRAYLDECGVTPGPERQDLFAGIQACEAAALEVWAEKQASQSPQHP